MILLLQCQGLVVDVSTAARKLTQLAHLFTVGAQLEFEGLKALHGAIVLVKREQPIEGRVILP